MDDHAQPATAADSQRHDTMDTQMESRAANGEGGYEHPTTTFTLADRITKLKGDVDDLKERQADLLDEAETARAEGDRESFRELEVEYADLETDRVETEGLIEMFHEYESDWGTTAFTIRQFPFNKVMQKRDELEFHAQQAQTRGEETTGNAAYRIAVLQLGVVDSPADAPSVEELPMAVAQHLYDAINAFNTRGELDMGNSSLREALRRRG